MRYYHIITFGCQMNFSDSERIASLLESINFRYTPDITKAKLIVINACSVRQKAIDRIYGLLPKLRKLQKENKAKIILTGCVTKQDQRFFSQYFDYLLSIKTLPQWPEFLKKRKYFTFNVNNKDISYLKIKPKYSNKYSAFIPISTGCNNFCSFCIVPFVRGPEISRPAKDIIQEVENVISQGYKEIWLLGQNVDSYKYKNIKFSELIKEINALPGEFWIRFMSPLPQDFSPRIIKTLASSKKFAPWINLPMQSGDDYILKKMNRRYSVKEFKHIVKETRNAFKKYRNGLDKILSLSTDIIVGFPGETNKMFLETAKVFKQLHFDMAYISEYSSRPGTAASLTMQDDVPHSEKEKRKRMLNKILENNAFAFNKKFLHKTIDVLVENKIKGLWKGKSRQYKTVEFKALSNKDLIGNFIKVKIDSVTPWGMHGVEVQT